MSIASISGYSNPLAWTVESTQNQRDRDNVGFGNEGSNRNTGPDTVSISSNALEMLNAASEASRKPAKLDSAGLLAFLKFDTFREEAMGYVKARATAHAIDEDNENESDILSEELESAEGNRSKKGVALLNGKHASKEELHADDARRKISR